MTGSETKPQEAKNGINSSLAGTWRRRTLVLSVAFVLLMMATGLVGIVAARYTTSLYRHALNRHLLLERELRLTLLAFTTADFQRQRFLQSQSQEAEREFYAGLDDFYRHLKRLDELAAGEIPASVIHALEEAMEDYRRLAERGMAAGQKGDLQMTEALYRGELAACRQDIFSAGERIGAAIEAHNQETDRQAVAALRWLAIAKAVLGLAFAAYFGLCVMTFRQVNRLAQELAGARRQVQQGGIGGKFEELLALLNARLAELQDVAVRLEEKTRYLRGAVDTLAEGAEQAAGLVMNTTWAAFQAARDAEAVSAGSVTLSDTASVVTQRIGAETAKLATVLEEVDGLQETLERACMVLRRLEAAVSEGKELGGFRQEIAGLAALLNPEGGATGEAVRRITEALGSFQETLGVLEQWGEEFRGLMQRLLALKEQVTGLGAMAEQHTAMVEEVTSSIYVVAQMTEELEALAARLKGDEG